MNTLSQEDRRLASLIERAKDVASLAAPVTVITGLLVYFGYVATRARFEYFGVSLDLTELSNQALVLSGLEVAYVPIAFVFLTILLAVSVHAGVHWLLSRPGRPRLTFVMVLLAAGGGALLVSRALVGILVVDVARSEVPGTTALALAAGPCLIGYAAWIAAYVGRRRSPRFVAWYSVDVVRRLRLAGTLAVTGLLVAGLFWAANSFAWAYGAGRGYDDALRLAQRPEVILDTVDPLADVPADVSESHLTEGGFRYRYRGLRLLVASGGRLFVVPERWSARSRTLVIPYDAAVRVQVAPMS